METNIHRYDEIKSVNTLIDPLRVYCSWIEGLRSKEHVADILRKVHGFNTSSEINKASLAINAHALHAVNFIQQGLLGPKEVSFLPLYYGLLNLSKILIIVQGYQNELSKNKYHGVSYDKDLKQSQDLLNEIITLHKKGTISLYYKSLTNEELVKTQKQVSVNLKDIYLNITSLSVEIYEIYGITLPYVNIGIKLIGDNQSGYHLEATVQDGLPRGYTLRHLKAIKNFSKKQTVTTNKNGTRTHDLTTPHTFVTKKCVKSKEEAREYLCKEHLNRHLLNNFISQHTLYVRTPLSKKTLIFSEELCILLALFHMSSIVRYNPEMLEKLINSKAWSLLLGLTTDGLLSFFEIFWSNFKNNFVKIVT